jgi:hypothetical protein
MNVYVIIARETRTSLKKSIDQSTVDGVDVPVTIEIQNYRHLHF